MESAPVGLMVVDQEGEIIYCNNSASKILGYERNEIEGKGWAEIFFDNEKNADFNDVFVDVIWKKKINLRKEVSYYSPSGKIRHLSTTSSFLCEEDKIAGIVILLDDITNIFLMRQREKSMLKEKNRIEKERAESLKKLSLGVAHEIRNPTVFIGGFANRMLKQIGQVDPLTKYLEKIVSGTKRLEDIVKAVNDYAYITSVTLNEISIIDLFEKTRNKLNKKQVHLLKNIDWCMEIENVRLFADPKLLSHALYEILSNALDSIINDYGEITFKSYKNNNFNYIKVSDTGSGIYEGDLPFVFDPFFSTKTNKIGMGLTNAQRIISVHGGKIKIDSILNKGTKVTFVFPDQKAVNQKGVR